MTHIVKCAVCKKTRDRDSFQMVRYGKNRHACLACFPQGDIIPMNMGGKSQDQINLEEYIKELFGYDVIPKWVNKQIKNFVTEKNMSYRGILKTLQYWYEVRKESVEKAKGGIGIVPFIFNEAKTYYFRIYQAQERNKNKTEKDFELETRIVIIEEPYFYNPPIKEFKFWEDDEDE